MPIYRPQLSGSNQDAENATPRAAPRPVLDVDEQTKKNSRRLLGRMLVGTLQTAKKNCDTESHNEQRLRQQELLKKVEEKTERERKELQAANEERKRQEKAAEQERRRALREKAERDRQEREQAEQNRLTAVWQRQRTLLSTVLVTKSSPPVAFRPIKLNSALEAALAQRTQDVQQNGLFPKPTEADSVPEQIGWEKNNGESASDDEKRERSKVSADMDEEKPGENEQEQPDDGAKQEKENQEARPKAEVAKSDGGESPRHNKSNNHSTERAESPEKIRDRGDKDKTAKPKDSKGDKSKPQNSRKSRSRSSSSSSSSSASSSSSRSSSPRRRRSPSPRRRRSPSPKRGRDNSRKDDSRGYRDNRDRRGRR
eukprot:c6934_g1_i2.p1 GENE.c6934_g1_i2~~c6934_g1_i2.p1  ORF type:complete len:370 (+),score=46.70 c6934_g1_i2:263-1372(+)